MNANLIKSTVLGLSLIFSLTISSNAFSDCWREGNKLPFKFNVSEEILSSRKSIISHDSMGVYIIPPSNGIYFDSDLCEGSAAVAKVGKKELIFNSKGIDLDKLNEDLRNSLFGLSHLNLKGGTFTIDEGGVLKFQKSDGSLLDLTLVNALAKAYSKVEQLEVAVLESRLKVTDASKKKNFNEALLSSCREKVEDYNAIILSFASGNNPKVVNSSSEGEVTTYTSPQEAKRIKVNLK